MKRLESRQAAELDVLVLEPVVLVLVLVLVMLLAATVVPVASSLEVVVELVCS